MTLNFIKPLRCPPFVHLILLSACAFALAMAYVAEYVFDLKPCILCLYQRVPYFAVIAFGLFGLFIAKRNKSASVFALAGSGIAMLLNSLIAFYHTGVERKWWPSHLEGCATPDLSGNFDDLLARIEAAPVVRCDEIPWVDPILGLSMANYNIAFCLGLAIIAFVSLYLIKKSRQEFPQNQ